MGTCCLLGQASGVAAAMCIEKKMNPRGIGQAYIRELQSRMLRQDYYIPNCALKDPKDFAQKVRNITASSTSSGNVWNLLDGIARDVADTIHYWQSEGLNGNLVLEWKKPVKLSTVEMKFDTNLHRVIMMQKNPDIAATQHQIPGLPPELVKSFSIEAYSGKRWKTVAEIDNNCRRYVSVSIPAQEVKKIRINLKNTYGSPNIRLYEIRCY